MEPSLTEYCDGLPFQIRRINEQYFFSEKKNFTDKTLQKEKQDRHPAFIKMLKSLCLVCRTASDNKTKSTTVVQILNLISAHYDYTPYFYFVESRPIAPFVRDGMRLLSLDLLRTTNKNFTLWTDMVLGRNLFNTSPMEILTYLQSKIMYNEVLHSWLDTPQPVFDLDVAMNLIFEQDKELIAKLVAGDDNFYTLLARMKTPFKIPV